jgi:hypothetical protein
MRRVSDELAMAREQRQANRNELANRPDPFNTPSTAQHVFVTRVNGKP